VGPWGSRCRKQDPALSALRGARRLGIGSRLGDWAGAGRIWHAGYLSARAQSSSGRLEVREADSKSATVSHQQALSTTAPSPLKAGEARGPDLARQPAQQALPELVRQAQQVGGAPVGAQAPEHVLRQRLLAVQALLAAWRAPPR